MDESLKDTILHLLLRQPLAVLFLVIFISRLVKGVFTTLKKLAQAEHFPQQPKPSPQNKPPKQSHAEEALHQEIRDLLRKLNDKSKHHATPHHGARSQRSNQTTAGVENADGRPEGIGGTHATRGGTKPRRPNKEIPTAPSLASRALRSKYMTSGLENPGGRPARLGGSHAMRGGTKPHRPNKEILSTHLPQYPSEFQTYPQETFLQQEELINETFDEMQLYPELPQRASTKRSPITQSPQKLRRTQSLRDAFNDRHALAEALALSAALSRR